MDDVLKKVLKDSWQNCNESTIGFAECIPENIWHEKPFKKRFRSFSWEFACILRTRMCYIKGFKIGKAIFSHQDDIPDKSLVESWNKAEVINKLRSINVDVLVKIECISDQNGISLMLWLIQHERIHQGKLMLYCSQIHLTLPENFVTTWGKSNFTKK